MSRIDLRAPTASRPMLAAAIVLIAFNLRPALSSLAPVLDEVKAGTGLTAAGASLIATGPVLCLGIFAALAPALSRRIGPERAVLLALAVSALGSLLRGVDGIAALLVGSLAAGCGIGVQNVLLPGLVKRDFAERAPMMTGCYSMSLCVGAAVAAGATAPLRSAFGGSWNLALTFWALPAFAALGFTVFAWRRKLGGHVQVADAMPARSLWRDGLAWQVTAFMGLQSLMVYSMFSWMAPILRSRGDSAITAGLVVSVSVLCQVAASLPTPIYAARLARQSGPAVVAMLAVLAGMLGLILGPLWLQWAFGVVMGLGMGAAFALAILMIVLRSPNAEAAARLSSMAQSVGYCFAALGPLAIGVANHRTGDWTGAIVLFVICGLAGAIAGGLAGRARLVRG